MSQARTLHALVCAIALASVAAPEPVAAQEELPAPVAADVKSNEALCRDAGGTPNARDAVKRADLNGDGKPDFVFLNGWIDCAGAASIYGDREKALTVYAGDGAGGAVSAFSDMVFDAKIEGAGAASKLWLTVMGAGCGKPPAASFAEENFCDRPLLWNAKTRKFEYAPVSTVRMIE
jgi:hypothetical protein